MFVCGNQKNTLLSKSNHSRFTQGVGFANSRNEHRQRQVKRLFCIQGVMMDTLTKANMIADVLHYVGYKTRLETADTVHVWLNRPISIMEVKTAIETSTTITNGEQVVEDCDFTPLTRGGVLIYVKQ